MTLDVESLIPQLREYLAGRGDVRLALLFGSRAKGTARESSDMDLAVDAPSVELGELAARLAERFGVEVDIVRLKDATIPLQEELIQSSLVVHEGRPGAAAIWRSHTLGDLETDRIWYGRMRDAWLRRVAERGLPGGQ